MMARPPAGAPATAATADAGIDRSPSNGASDGRDRDTVQSVQRALGLLSLFAPRLGRAEPARAEWTVTDLARVSGLHKSVVARLLATMAVDGWVVQHPVTKAYRIGPQAFAVGNAYEPLAVLTQAARPVLEELTARCGHASYLGVPAGRHYVFLVAVESTRSIRVSIRVGENRAYHAGAIGKVLLAAMNDAQIREAVGPDPLPTLTPQTIASVDALLAEIAEVRESGVALNREESIPGAASIAVAVQDANGQTVAGIAIVYPTHIVDQSEIEGLVAAVREAGAAISQRLRGMG